MLSWCCLQVAVANTGAIFAPNFLVYCVLRFVCAFGLAGIILTSTALSESLARPTCCHGAVGKMGLKATTRGSHLHAFASPFSGGVDHDPQAGCHHDDPGLCLLHRPDAPGGSGLRPAGLAHPPSGSVNALLCHLPDILVGTMQGLFPWGGHR